MIKKKHILLPKIFKMKTKFLVLFVLVFFTFISCKNENAKTATKENQAEKSIDDIFKVSVNALVKKNDNFQLYYIEKSDEMFSEEKSIWIEVKGMDVPQNLIFNLPKDIVPSLIRLDFGVSDNQEDITISGFEMSYFGKKFSATGSVMENYLRPLDGTNIDFKTGIIKANLKNGKRVEPVLYPHEIPLGNEISKIVK